MKQVEIYFISSIDPDSPYHLCSGCVFEQMNGCSKAVDTMEEVGLPRCEDASGIYQVRID